MLDPRKWWAQRTKENEQKREEKQAAADELWLHGSRLLERRQINPAIATMMRAMKLEPSRLEGRLNLGAALFLAKKYAEALPHLQYVLAFEPQNAVALLNLAACQDALGKPDESIAALEQLVRERPTWNDAHYNLAVAYYKQDRLDDAIEALRAEIKVNAEHPHARDLLEKIRLSPAYARAEARAQMEAKKAREEAEAAAKE
jgi:tetratricopeptide (TPR) repeat protein